MQKIIIYTILILALSSCVTKRACQNKFPPQVRVDSIHISKTVTKYRDTTVYIYIPADTVFKTDTLIIDVNGNILFNRIESDLKWSYAAAWVENNNLMLEHRTKDDSIAQTIRDAIRLIEKTEGSIVTKTIIEGVQFIPWWAKVLMWLSIPTILYILFKIIRIFV